MYKPGTFGYDREFLEKYLPLVILENGDSKLMLCPDLQGRILTSTAEGEQGQSFGWINYNLVASQKHVPHCNNFGGEDRFWIGPEGGQYSIFFKKGKPFDLEHWQTPAAIDTEKWKLLDSSPANARLQKIMALKNYSGFMFELEAEREISLFESGAISSELGIQIEKETKAVGFKSVNKMTNICSRQWKKETGLLSIWILGQLIPSAKTTAILPVNPLGKGPMVNDSYFGKIGEERLKILDNAILFKADGLKRGKIGITPGRARPVIGSYDAKNQVLTIVKYTIDKGNADYVNSAWEYQDDPFSGDVVNSYNDGPLPDGTTMGPFFELETSSPAACLRPGESMVHEHASYHFTGPPDQMNRIAMDVLDLNLDKCF